MLALSSKTTTLFTFLTLILLATAIEAHTPLERRGGHAQLKRIIKKRAPQGIFGDDVPPPLGPIGAAPIPESDIATASDATPSSASQLSASASASASRSGSASASASGSASVSASVSASSGSASVSASAESSVSASASASVESSASVTEAPPAEVTQAPVGPTFLERSTSTRQALTRVVTNTVDAEPSAPPSMAGAAAADKSKSNIATVLIAVVASVGGVFILWTIFRKWKLGSSKKFDRRMQPIDWEKTEETHHRRQSDSSFRSAGAHSARSPNGLHGLPEHDFTAGPTQISPVGGYADMARGSSPPFGRNGRY